MSNLLKTELYKLFHSWYFWGIGIFNLLLSSILLLDSKERSSNLIMASLYNIPLLYFLSIVFIALFIGSDFSGRTLNTYITAGHKRSSIFRVKLIVSQIGCIIILVFPLFVHGIISQFYIGEKLFWNDSTYTMVLLTLFAMITLCALPMFFAFIFRDMGKTLTVSMVLFFVMIFLLNSESAQIISRIIPMGQLRLISLQKVYSTNFCLFVDFLWNFILYFIAGSAFLHTDLKQPEVFFMDKLLKLEKYQLLHNSIYWCGMIGIFILGFFTADTYVTEVMGPTEEIASSLADIFNGMVYDSTFLLIIMSAILALILGQEFSKRTINLEVSAGHSRKQIFTSKIISYLVAFNLMALVYPVSGCIREFGRFGVADVGMFFYNIIKAIIYSCLLNSAIFLIAILICCYLQDAVKATSVTAIIIFGLSLYLGYGMMLRLPVGFLPTYQIRIVVSMKTFFQPIAILVGCIWSSILVLLSWIKFCKCDFK